MTRRQRLVGLGVVGVILGASWVHLAQLGQQHARLLEAERRARAGQVETLTARLAVVEAAVQAQLAPRSGWRAEITQRLERVEGCACREGR